MSQKNFATDRARRNRKEYYFCWRLDGTVDTSGGTLNLQDSTRMVRGTVSPVKL